MVYKRTQHVVPNMLAQHVAFVCTGLKTIDETRFHAQLSKFANLHLSLFISTPRTNWITLDAIVEVEMLVSDLIYKRIHLIPKTWSEHGVEALWTGQRNIFLSCPQCLDSMLAPGFWK